MPRVPLPGIPNVQPASYQGAAPADITAKYRGQAALAQGIGDAAGAVQQFALRSQEAKNEADYVRGKLAMEKAEADIQADLENEPNAQKWEEIAERRLQEASGTALASVDLAPEVRRRLDTDMQVFAQRTSTSVRNQAQRRQNDENDKVLADAQARAVDTGDLAEAERYVEVRRRLGLISDQRAQLENEEVRYGVDRQAVNRAINEDPIAAIEMLEDKTEGGKYRHFKNLSESDRMTALRSAKTARETLRAETAQAIAEDIYAGNALGIDRRIDEALEMGELLASQARNLKRLARGERSPTEQAATAARMWQEALDLEKSDPDYKQKAMRLRAEAHGLAPEVKEPILDVLNQKNGTADVKEDVRMVYAQLDRDYRANIFGNVQTYTKAEAEKENARREKEARRLFGKNKEWTPVAEGDPKDAGSFERASSRLFEVQRAMRDWLEAHPDATFAEIQQQRAELTANDVTGTVADDLIDELSGAAP